MTKKDYELIADNYNLLVRSMLVILGNVNAGVTAIKTYRDFELSINQVINRTADMLQDDNPKFDRVKFIKAVNKQL